MRTLSRASDAPSSRKVGLSEKPAAARRVFTAGLALVLLFVIFTAFVKTFGSGALDHRSERFADAVAGGSLHACFAFIEPLGSPLASLFLGVVLVAAVAAKRGAFAGVAILAALGLLTLIEGLLRIRLDELPWDHLAAFLQHPRGWHLVHSGYPSGHTARLGLLTGIAAAAIAPARPVVGGIVVVGVTFWIAVQRVESRHHTGADVIGGALLAWGLVLLYAAAVSSFPSIKDAFRRRFFKVNAERE